MTNENHISQILVRSFEQLKIQYPHIYSEIKSEYAKSNLLERYFQGWSYIISNKIMELTVSGNNLGAVGILAKIKSLSDTKRFGKISIAVDIISMSISSGDHIKFLIENSVVYIMK